jgi:hypothetical protein
MDLNVKVRFWCCSCLHHPPQPKNRSTSRECSSHGTGITFSTSKTLWSRSVVTRARRLTGIGHWVPLTHFPVEAVHRNNLHSDSHDMYNSPFFDGSSNGVGGWGDPKNDYQISTGGFKDEIRVYPTPHHIRRNFSVYPFTNPDVSPPFGADPNAPPRPVGLQINTTMTKQNVDGIVANFTGDFFGFQAYFESPAVSSSLLSALSRKS